MPDQYDRTRMLLGEDGLGRLRQARVALFGLGGVGGYALEALARAGVGHLALFDNDVFSETNLNRQLLATRDTLGLSKVEVARDRVRAIDPSIEVETFPLFFLPENGDTIDFSRFSYVIDAIDTVAGKLALIQAAQARKVPIISCMGTGNKLDPTAFRVADISQTRGCALARVMRKECAKRGLKGVKVVYSQEEPAPTRWTPEVPEPQKEGSSRRSLPGSLSFVPAAAGLILAGEVIRALALGE